MAAERWGGRYSPGAPKGSPQPGNSFSGRPAQRVSVRARLLYLLPVPMLFAGLSAIGRGSPSETLAELGGFAAAMLGAHLANEGLRAEAAYDARRVAKPPAVPRKLFGALLTGAGVTAASLFSGPGLFGGLVFGGLAALAFIASFGLDPRKRKGLTGTDEVSADRVARAIDEAERLVGETAASARSIGDRSLQTRIERLCDQAREVFRIVEADPRDLSRARRFLNVYLLGLRDATVKFAELWRRSRDEGARTRYEELITDLEASFASHRRDLLEDNRSDLDIEIEVLRERLEQDGLIAR